MRFAHLNLKAWEIFQAGSVALTVSPVASTGSGFRDILLVPDARDQSVRPLRRAPSVHFCLRNHKKYAEDVGSLDVLRSPDLSDGENLRRSHQRGTNQR